jgi:hypothetical protein
LAVEALREHVVPDPVDPMRRIDPSPVLAVIIVRKPSERAFRQCSADSARKNRASGPSSTDIPVWTSSSVLEDSVEVSRIQLQVQHVDDGVDGLGLVRAMTSHDGGRRDGTRGRSTPRR